jgi:Mg-chelatase subunit ChlD
VYAKQAGETVSSLREEGKTGRTILIIITDGIYNDEVEFINAVITVSAAEEESDPVCRVQVARLKPHML